MLVGGCRGVNGAKEPGAKQGRTTLVALSQERSREGLRSSLLARSKAGKNYAHRFQPGANLGEEFRFCTKA